MRPFFVAVTVLLAVVAACGGATPTDLFGKDGSTDGSNTTSDGATGNKDGSAGDARTDSGPSKTCTGNFGPYDKGCTSTDNCATGLHQIDCCGTTIFIGFNHAEKIRFDADEAAWEKACPDCDCPAQPTKAEDGKTCSTPQVECVKSGTGGTGQCKTHC